MQLTCEYLREPLGVQNPKPRFAWRVSGEMGKIRFEVSTAFMFGAGAGGLNSGEVFSARSCAVEYNGLPLAGQQCYRWQVEIS